MSENVENEELKKKVENENNENVEENNVKDKVIDAENNMQTENKLNFDDFNMWFQKQYEEYNKHLAQLALEEGYLKAIEVLKEKYDTPEFLQNDIFSELFKEAYYALGENLDSEKFIQLVDKYVNSRIDSLEKSRSASLETNKILDSMTFNKNTQSSIKSPKKTLDQMTQAEVEEMLARVL